MSNTTMFTLSDRLLAIVSLVPPGGALCDVGCDHAHVPIWLLAHGVIDRAIGMDVISGPLQKARENLEAFGESERVELRLSNGLDAYRAGEADTLVIAGMGGRIMENILRREMDKTRSFSSMVLEPQADPGLVRAALRDAGFLITSEKLVYNEGKYYPVIRADRRQKGQEQRRPDWPEGTDESLCRQAEDDFGPLLLCTRDAVLFRYLLWRERGCEKILAALERAAEGSTRRAQVLQEREEIRLGLSLFAAER